MEKLMNKEDREVKQAINERKYSKIEKYRKKISDDVYLDHAIRKIAIDLSNYLTK